jgi:hypothetical protein
MKTLQTRKSSLTEQIRTQANNTNVANTVVREVVRLCRPELKDLLDELDATDRMLSKWHWLKTRNALKYGERRVGETAPYCGHGYTEYTFDNYTARFHENDESYRERYGVPYED